MDRATDGEDRQPVTSCHRMTDFADLKARIEALCARATSDQRDARLLVEIEDLLAEGYVGALQGDNLCRRLQSRLDALMDAADGGEQLLLVARERRRVAEATQDLRRQLAVMREHWVALGSERIGLA